MVRPDRVIGSIVSVRIWPEAKEVFLRIVAVTCPGLEVQVVVCKPRKSEPRFGRPIPLDTTGRPDFKRPGVGEEIAITKAQTVGEAAAGGQRAEFGMEALAVEDEDRPFLGEVQGALQTVRLVGLDLFGLLFATLAVDLFACRRFLRPRDARREYRQRQAQQRRSEHAPKSTSIGRQPTTGASYWNPSGQVSHAIRRRRIAGKCARGFVESSHGPSRERQGEEARSATDTPENTRHSCGLRAYACVFSCGACAHRRRGAQEG